LWDGAWLAILAIGTLPMLHVPAMPFQLLAPIRDADRAARVRPRSRSAARLPPPR